MRSLRRPKQIKGLGAELAVGDIEDRESLIRAADGVDAVYTMSTFFEAGLDAEVRQGTAVADATLSAGVPHLVFSSVGSADRKTGIPHFETKYRVERHIESIGVPHTVVRPVYFYENVLNPFTLPALMEGTLAIGMPADRPLQQIGVRDIAAFVVLALENRDSFLGKSIDIAGDELTGQETARILSEASGRMIEYVQTPMEQVRAMGEDFALNLEWFNDVGYSADIPYLRTEFPEVEWETFEEWARRQDWTVLNGSSAQSA